MLGVLPRHARKRSAPAEANHELSDIQASNASESDSATDPLPEKKEPNGLPRALLALAIGSAGGFLFAYLRLPLPWMMGAMVATTVASVAGANIRIEYRLRMVMIAILGVMLGSGFRPEMMDHIAEWSVSIAMLALYVGVIGLVAYLRTMAPEPAPLPDPNAAAEEEGAAEEMPAAEPASMEQPADAETPAATEEPATEEAPAATEEPAAAEDTTSGETMVVPPTVSEDAPKLPHKGEPPSPNQPQPVYPDGL